MTRVLVALAVVLVIVGIAQTVILYRYTSARDDVISQAEKHVMRARLDVEGEGSGES